MGINCSCGEPSTMSPISMAKPASERISAPLVNGIAFGCPVVPLVCRIAADRACSEPVEWPGRRRAVVVGCQRPAGPLALADHDAVLRSPDDGVDGRRRDRVGDHRDRSEEREEVLELGRAEAPVDEGGTAPARISASVSTR